MNQYRDKLLASLGDLNAFRNFQNTLIYARYKDNPQELYYLKEGTTGNLRAWIEENLECPIKDCQSRGITMEPRVGEKRDSFKHLANIKEHESKEVFALQGRALVSKLVKEQYPGIKVEDGDSLMLTWLTGEQLAIEVQYDPLTFIGWEAKQNTYLEKGIPCLWLFGHLPLHFPDWIPQLKQVTLLPLQQQVLLAGTKILWINPIAEQIASILSEVILHACLIPECQGKDPECLQTFNIEYTGKENNSYISLQPLSTAKIISTNISLIKLQHLEQEPSMLEKIRDVERLRAEIKKTKLVELFSLEQKKRDSKIQDLINTSELEKSRPTARKPVKNSKPSRTGYSCSICGYPLSELLKDEGRHVLC